MIKYFKSDNYNFKFDTENGLFVRYGKTLEDDPSYSPFGPEIIDCEVSSICHGSAKTGPCQFCYKSNTAIGKNMSYETFVKLFNKLPKETLTQVAFGVGDIDGNEHLWNIMQYCRKNNVIPNITINGSRMTPKYYNLLSALCGAVAISNYDKDTCYNAVYELTKRGMKQVNIHMLSCQELYQDCIDVMLDMKRDKRLKDMNAVVFLALKPKGKRNIFTPLTKQLFKNIVDYAISSKINFGFDSCSSHSFLDAAKDRDNIKQLKMMVEPCESSLFSGFISVDAEFFPCSFGPGVGEWKEGINLLEINDFVKDVWNHPKLVKYRNMSLAKDRKCLLYDMELK